MNGKHLAACGLILFFILWIMIGTAFAQTGKPNILVIWGDDIGTTNISFNNRGMMGHMTPDN
jgi:arylsulfatase